MQIKIYNTISKNIETIKPINENNEIRVYSCGPTVYNYAHLGNIRAFLFPDLLQKVLKTIGKFDVKWVMNITDVDDKTIKNSEIGSSTWQKEMGEQSSNNKENLNKFTNFYIKEFLVDLDLVNIKKSDFYKIPRATEYISEMQKLVKLIYKNGFAYVSDGSIYFSISKWREKSEYGLLKKIDFENFVVGERVDNDEYDKEQVFDFVLWKGKKENEPFWEFTLDGNVCDGRPGWHLECSAMEKEILGLPFEIHTGGVDLCFPHHEDEIAQSTAGYGISPTKYWCHNEFLEVEGKKMSKSLGNYFTLREVIDKGINPVDIRFAMLSAHYRSIYNFTFADIESSKKGRLRIQEYIYKLLDFIYENQELTTLYKFYNDNLSQLHIDDIQNEKLKKYILDVWGNLSFDLHTPKALASVFSIINNIEIKVLSKNDILILVEFFDKFNQIFNSFELITSPKIEVNIPDEITKIAESRFQAKLAKNWAEADKIRLEIEQLGYQIKDNKEGFEIIKL